MTEVELGTALREARTARGLSLHDVERDTRISSKYLKALEEGELEVLPAPVYARAFTRTYAQYLGLDAAQFVQRLPGARPEPELPPLPEVSRDVATTPLSASWLVAGAVVAILFVMGLVLLWSRGGDGGEESVSGNVGVEEDAGQGAESFEPPISQPPQVTAGIVPDLEGEHVLVALAALDDAGLPYLVIEVENDDVDNEHVYQQNPSADTEAADSTVVTLLVSR